MSDKNLTQSHHSRVYDNFLMHWKYIKREKVNGKWKYIYDLPATNTNSKAEKVTTVANAVATGSKYIDDEYQKNLESNSKKNVYPDDTGSSTNKDYQYLKRDRVDGEYRYYYENSDGKRVDVDTENVLSIIDPVKGRQYVYNENRVETVVDKDGSKSHDYFQKLQDETNANLDKQDKNGTKSTVVKTIDDEYQKELESNSKKNVYPTNTLAENTKKAKDEKLTDKIKKTADGIADKLGFDEREEYVKAKEKYESAKNKYDDADLIADEELRKFRESTVQTWTKDDRDRLNMALSTSSFWRDTMQKRGEEYAAAKSTYYKTPIGTIAKFANTGREWLKDLFD